MRKDKVSIAPCELLWPLMLLLLLFFAVAVVIETLEKHYFPYKFSPC